MDTAPLLQQHIAATPPDTTCWAVLCAAALLIACSGLVSASEMAFFSLSPENLDTIRADKHPSDSMIRKLLDRSGRLLATILICNTLVNIAVITLLDYFISHTISFGNSRLAEFLFITILLTFLLLLFGEIIPKIYSAQHTLRLCRLTAPAFTVLDKALRPLSALLTYSQAATGRVISFRADTLTVSDLEQALELTDKEEIKEESRMLEGIIRFSGETVKEIMTPRVDLVDIEQSVPFSEVLRCATQTNVSRIPVYAVSQDNIKGILYTKDLLPHLTKTADFRWQSLVRPPYFVPETKMIDDLLRDFQRLRVHIAIVVDEFGGTSGIVTMEDILEEIVGEIDDEYDEIRRPYTRLNKENYIFDGKCPLVDAVRILSLGDGFFSEVEGDADTLAGLMLEIKGEFPLLREKITYRHLTFEIMEMDERRIVKIKVTAG